MRRSWSESVWNGPVVVTAILGAGFASWMAWRGEPLGHCALAFGLGLAFPTLVLAVLALAWFGPRDGRLERQRRAFCTLLTSILCVVALQVPGCMAAMAVQPRRNAEAKLWCEQLVSDLERWRAEHGHYPEDVQDFERAVEAPRAFRYRRDEDGEFTIDLYTEFDSVMAYSSRIDSWERCD